MNNPALKALYVSNGIFVFAGAMLVPLYAIFAENIGATILSISALTSVLLIAKVATVIFLQRFGDGFAEKEYLLVAGFIVRAVGWIGLLFFQTIPALFVAQIILGFGDGLGSPSFRALFATHLDRGKEVKRYSEWELILAAGGSVGALAGGYIVTNYSFETLFVVMSALATVSAIIILTKPRSLL